MLGGCLPFAIVALGSGRTSAHTSTRRATTLAADAATRQPHPNKTKQVVAGTNHILTLQVSDAAGPKTVTATVWEKLPGAAGANGETLELTKYELAAQQV